MAISLDPKPSKPVAFDIASPQDLQTAIGSLRDDELIMLFFGSPRSQPCKTLEPVLERVAAKHAPRVRIAKINIDTLAALAQQLNVRAVPSVLFVFQGQVAAQFSGPQPEQVVEQYVKQLLPPAEEEVNALDEANKAMRAGRWDVARRAFEMLVREGDDKAGALLGLARCHIHARDEAAALDALGKIDAPGKFDERDRLKTIVGLIGRAKEIGGTAAAAARATASPSDWNAAFDWAICLAVDEQFDAACEALLRIIEHDKNFKGGEARTLLVALFAAMGADAPAVREFRARLSRALFI